MPPSVWVCLLLQRAWQERGHRKRVRPQDVVMAMASATASPGAPATPAVDAHDALHLPLDEDPLSLDFVDFVEALHR